MSQEEQQSSTNGAAELEKGTDSVQADGNDNDEKVAFLPKAKSSASVTRRRPTVDRASNPVIDKVLNYKIRLRRSKDELSSGHIFAFLLMSIIVLFLIGRHYSSPYNHVSSPHAAQEWGSLKLEDIQNWCLNESNCMCANPLYPKRKYKDKGWSKAHRYNKDQAVLFSANNLDVVFLGDSITEAWNGMSFGIPVKRTKGIVPIFKSLFRKEHGAKFEGLALGISGDKTSNLLWRIQNGEIPDTLNPKVWWILIGTNDFMGKRKRDKKHHKFCSEEVVTMGILRVLEELRRIRPDAKIVVNALLPRADCNENNENEGQLYETKLETENKSLWMAIEVVNQRLQEFCNEHEKFYYVDFKRIFMAEKNKHSGLDKFYIPNHLMADYLHPTARGYKIWGKEIEKELSILINI